jgi:hypothetical protein
MNRDNLLPNPPITPISLLEEPVATYLSRKPDRRPADHEEHAADRFSKKMVISGVTAVIG